MNIITNLTKADLLKSTLWFCLRTKNIYIQMVLLFVFIFFMECFFKGFPKTSENWFVYLALSTLIAILALILQLIFIILVVGFSSYRNAGVIGEHHFTINETGLFEKTNINESRHAWKSISGIYVFCGYLFIKIGNGQFHIIPKKSFSSIDNFEKCIATVRNYHRNAKNK